jgi:hypothetical protein
MSLQSFCQKPAMKSTPDDNVTDASSAMTAMNVGCLVIENGIKLCGIPTERKIPLMVTGAQRHPPATKIPDIKPKEIN